MSSYRSKPRLLAAGSGLAGLVYMMIHAEPSVETVAIGVSCLILCIGFSAVPTPKRPVRRRAATPTMPQLPPRSEPRTLQLTAGPQPHPMLMKEVASTTQTAPTSTTAPAASKLPSVPSQRQRIRDRRPPPKL